MFQKYKEQLYYEDEKIQIISLPYISNHLKFETIIILPNLTKYSSPIDYLNKEKITFNELYSKMKLKKYIHLYLPKFNINFQIDLIETLQKLGIKSLISKNFNNISSNQNLLFDKILQQTYFDINENGTNSDGIKNNNKEEISFDNNNYYMYVNHSFIYMIQSDQIKDLEGNYLMPFIGIINKLDNYKDKNYQLLTKWNLNLYNEDKPVKRSGDTENDSPGGNGGSENEGSGKGGSGNEGSGKDGKDDDDEPIKIITFGNNLNFNLDFIIMILILLY